MKYTKGPWKLELYTNHNNMACKRIVTSDNRAIAVDGDYGDGDVVDATVKEYKLIAAAPDLLSQLKNLREYLLEHSTDLNACFETGCSCEGHEDQKELMNQVELVIAKAEGNEESKKTNEYYIQLAKDVYGSAVRDNSRKELIAIGKKIDEGNGE